MSGWSMVWLAPVCLSSGGRSAVSRIMGTPSVAASTTAGNPLATAVPEVVIQAAGRPAARAYPSAANALPRSSKWMRLLASLFSASAATRGVERDPGATQKKSTPLRTSSSTMREAQRRLARGVSLGVKPEHPGEVADLLLDLRPLAFGNGPLDDPRTREKREPVPPHEPGPDPDGEFGGVRPDPAYRSGVPSPVEGLERPDLLQRLPDGVPADGRRGMQRAQHVGVSDALAERPANLGDQVPPARQLHLGDSLLYLELVAEWAERLRDTDADVLVLGLVFLAPEQLVAQLYVVPLRRAAGPGPGHGFALYGASLAPIEALGGRAHKGRPLLGLDVEVEAAGRGPFEALGEQGRIHPSLEDELRPSGENHLVQASLREGRERPLHAAPPS